MAAFPGLSRQAWPHDPQELDDFYGNPRGLGGNASAAWERLNLTTFTFPWKVKGAQTLQIHKKVKPSLERVLAAIWEHVGHDQTKIDAIHLNETGGTYAYRTNRNNPSVLSNHARAIAIDLAPDENPNRKAWSDDGTMLPRFVIEAFKAEGWRWGGDFNSTKDAMHFEAVFDQHHDQPPVPAPQPGAVVPAPPARAQSALPGAIKELPMLPGFGPLFSPTDGDPLKAMLALMLRAGAEALLKNMAGQGSALQLPGIIDLVAHPAPPAAPAQPVNKQIIATVFGGRADPNESAYDRHQISDDEPGCALPFRFKGERPLVVITGPKGTATAPIVDVGPICPNKERGWPADPYWEKQRRPWAEENHVKSSAGIDLTPATARAVGIDGKGKVDWHFATATQGAQRMNPISGSPITSGIGATSIVGAIADLVVAYTTKDASRIGIDVMAIVTGVGFLFSKDFNVTGGSTRQ